MRAKSNPSIRTRSRHTIVWSLLHYPQVQIARNKWYSSRTWKWLTSGFSYSNVLSTLILHLIMITTQFICLIYTNEHALCSIYRASSSKQDTKKLSSCSFYSMRSIGLSDTCGGNRIKENDSRGRTIYVPSWNRWPFSANMKDYKRKTTYELHRKVTHWLCWVTHWR